ncbi:MAG: hypothetical protein Ct9H90mP3_0620 [Flammeovirgaceae bacterium]|nr:MAG: hypothetical protein Ct9H90mP3_0620 [Flammeovirgaceae bacterium]
MEMSIDRLILVILFLNPVNNLEYFVNTNKKKLEVEVISGQIT